MVIEAAQVLLLQGSSPGKLDPVSGKVRSSLAVMNHRNQSEMGEARAEARWGSSEL